MHNRSFTKFFGGTKRIREYELKRALDKLDDAYFALETDPETLKSADRPLINDPKAAQELVAAAMDLIVDLEDHGFTNMDHMIWDMKYNMDHFKKLKLEVDVVKGRYD